MPKLIEPTIKYKDSFLRGEEEMRKEKRTTMSSHLNMKKGEDFGLFVERLKGYSEGKDLPEGFVSESVCWLVEGDRYIGRIAIRHELTEHLKKVGGHIGYIIRPSERKKGYGKKILELALEKCQELGLKKVLVTCDEDNTASRKIIESNGGIFENKVKDNENEPAKLRFWIVRGMFAG